MPWRKGVLVACAPDILYAEDTDGDGKADKREVLFTGFAEGNQQHRVNGLAGAWTTGSTAPTATAAAAIRSAQDRQDASTSSGRDFRFRPDTGEFEADDRPDAVRPAPRRLGQLVRRQQQQPAAGTTSLDDHYLRRNPHLAAARPARARAGRPGAAPVYPLSRTLPRFNDLDAANHFTSACSPIVYRDDLFGPAFAGNTVRQRAGP